MKSITNAERTVNLLILLNLDKVCELPTNKVFIIDLVEEMNASLKATTGSFREYNEDAIVAAIKIMFLTNIYGDGDNCVFDILGLSRFSLEVVGTFLAELARISRQLIESVNVTALIIPVHELDRVICPELISADLQK